MLDRAALEALHVGELFAQAPQGRVLGLAGADGGVLDETVLDGLAKDGFQGDLELRAGLRGRQLDQRVGVVLAGDSRARRQ